MPPKVNADEARAFVSKDDTALEQPRCVADAHAGAAAAPAAAAAAAAAADRCRRLQQHRREHSDGFDIKHATQRSILVLDAALETAEDGGAAVACSAVPLVRVTPYAPGGDA